MGISIFSSTKTTRLAVALGLVGAGCFSGSAFAQTVTVDPTGTANGTTVFTDLQSALASFGTGGTNTGNVAANVINVRADHGPVIGKVTAVVADSTSPAAPVTLTIDDDITIQGVDGTGSPALAVFAGQANLATDQTLRTGAFPAFAWRQAVDLTVKNIAFIPADPAGGQLINSFMVVKAPGVAGQNPVVNIEDCVFTANDGSNQPLTTTGRPEDDAKLGNAGVIGMAPGAAGIWGFSRSERGDLTINVTNSVFASMTPLTGANPRVEAFKVWMSGLDTDFINCFLNINEGCVFANLDGNVAQVSWSSIIRMKGTETNPIIVRNLQNAGSPAVVWLYYAPADLQPVAGEFDYVRFYDCLPPVIAEGGVLGDGSRAWINHVKNCVFANTGDGISLRAVTGLLDTTGFGKDTVTVEDSVFHNAGTGTNAGALYGFAAATRPVTITNSIFTDNSTKYGLYNTSTAVWTVTDSVLSTTGANPLVAATGGTGTINVDASVTNGEVTYENMDDPFAANFFEPTANSSVNDWSIY